MKNKPNESAQAFGHLDRLRQEVRSTKKILPFGRLYHGGIINVQRRLRISTERYVNLFIFLEVWILHWIRMSFRRFSNFVLSRLAYKFSQNYANNFSREIVTSKSFFFTSGAAITGAAAIISIHSIAAASPLKIAECDSNPVRHEGEPYPVSKPYFSKLLKVSDIHSVHYEVYGNPNGKPVLVVHGGPGAGTSPKVIYILLMFPI